jgi:arabinofuranosyltransferase
MDESIPNHEHRLARSLLLLVFSIIVIRNAWVSDDAYITFRAIENFLAGYGLNFNPHIRVQVYTHPAWMFLLSGVYYLERLLVPSASNALYFIAVIVSIVFSVLTLDIILGKVLRADILTSIFVASAFILSRAYMDYSTSGLENPLSHLLLALFLWFYFKNREKIFLLTFIASLLIMNRQDLSLLVLPALFHAVWVNWKHGQVLKELAFGLVPILAWEFFSVFYYGFPFPNTAYAKLNTGIPSLILIQQGVDYLLNSLHWDALTLFIIIFAGISVFTLSSQPQEKRRLMALYVGVIAYVLYVVKIGGDFMSGRFLTAPFLASVVVLASTALSRNIILLVTTVTMLLGIFSVRSTLLEPRFPAFLSYDLVWDGNEITDERSIYFANSEAGIHQGFIENGLRNADVGSKYAGDNWYFTGSRKVMIETAIGMFGYVKGPNIHVMDREALSDPLLARLPTHQKKWRIGHFGRDLPDGYLETLETGENQIKDPNMPSSSN